MHLRKWIVVYLFLASTVPACAQAPYTQTGPGVYGGWQNYFGAANDLTRTFAARTATGQEPAGSPMVTSGGSGYVAPTLGYGALPIHVPIPKHPFVPSIRVNDGETLLYCVTGTVLSLAGYASADSYISPALVVDHRRVQADDVCKITGQYLFYWKADEPGLHTLRIMTTPADGAVPVIARQVHVVVSDKMPIWVSSLPQSCDADTQVSLARATAADFKPARSIVIVNDMGFDLADTQKTVTIPASKMPDGDYAFSTASYAADGTRFVAMPQIVHIQHGKGPDWSLDDVSPSSK